MPQGMVKDVTILTGNPIIEVIAEQHLNHSGILKMAEWVKSHRPDCIPTTEFTSIWDLLPHDQFDTPHNADRLGPSREPLSDNEVLCEISGRTCYHSFAEKAGKKTNIDYFEHITSMEPLHASIMYHAKMTFFFAGVSRKFSHQFIRNYVGSDRDEEGSPSQESTRFTHHYGWYVCPPYYLDNPDELRFFTQDCQDNYGIYTLQIDRSVEFYKQKYKIKPTGGARKDIYESAAGKLNMSAETSFVWSTNPMAIRKFLKERLHEAADAEIQRFAICLAKICFARWPNLFLGADLDSVRSAVLSTENATIALHHWHSDC